MHDIKEKLVTEENETPIKVTRYVKILRYDLRTSHEEADKRCFILLMKHQTRNLTYIC
jgi:hypothetical protein